MAAKVEWFEDGYAVVDGPKVLAEGIADRTIAEGLVAAAAKGVKALAAELERLANMVCEDYFSEQDDESMGISRF